MSIDKIKEGAKSVASLLSGIIIAVLAVGVDEPVAKYLAIAAAIVGAIIVWATPNAKTPAEKALIKAGQEALDKQAVKGQTYESLGGQPFDTDISRDEADLIPEADTLYQPGEVEGERFGNGPEDLPVSGNDKGSQEGLGNLGDSWGR